MYKFKYIVLVRSKMDEEKTLSAVEILGRLLPRPGQTIVERVEDLRDLHLTYAPLEGIPILDEGDVDGCKMVDILRIKLEDSLIPYSPDIKKHLFRGEGEEIRIARYPFLKDRAYYDVLSDFIRESKLSIPNNVEIRLLNRKDIVLDERGLELWGVEKAFYFAIPSYTNGEL